MKAIDLDLGPIRHWTQDRVRAHVLICTLAAYLVWHLRRTLASLTYTGETPPQPINPVAPATRSATRSATAERKARRHHHDNDQPLRDFTGLLTHLATLTRNDLRYGPDGPTVPTLSEPTDTQRRAFDLLGAPIPVTLK
jgi:hypothetical protein